MLGALSLLTPHSADSPKSGAGHPSSESGVLGFPGSSVVKNPPASMRHGFDAWSGKISQAKATKPGRNCGAHALEPGSCND